jgi:predicted nucleic acid-binding protein
VFLVDTTVWVDYFNDRDSPAVDFLEDLLRHPLSFGLCDQIVMELLQGTKDNGAFDKLATYLDGQMSYGFEDSKRSHIAAAEVYRVCRQQGFTIRSAFDCLIAQCALEHGLTLLHNDRDFLAIALALPDLKQHHFLH